MMYDPRSSNARQTGDRDEEVMTECGARASLYTTQDVCGEKIESWFSFRIGLHPITSGGK